MKICCFIPFKYVNMKLVDVVKRVGYDFIEKSYNVMNIR